MKNNLLRFGFSFTVFIFCLLGVEALFQANKIFKFIQPRTYDYNLTQLPVSERTLQVPESIYEEINQKYKDFKPQNYEIISELFRADKAFQVRKLEPYATNILINDQQHLKKSRYEIHETSYSNQKNVYIFDVKYEFDEHRRRIVKGQKIQPTQKNIVLLGCSLAFGVGVNQGEDLASFLHKKMPRYNIYNLGFPGGGMHQFMADIFQLNRLQDMNKQGGAVVYIMIYPHITRTFCSLECHEQSGRWMHRLNQYTYEFNNTGEPVLQDSYSKTRNALFYTREILAKSQFLKFIGYDRPKIHSEFEIDKYIKYLVYMQQHYKKMNLDFYVYFPKSTGIFPDNFFSMLEEQGVKYFDYNSSNSDLNFSSRITIPGDGHWTKMGNDFQASLIADYLKKQGY